MADTSRSARSVAWGICLITLAVVASAIVLVIINREFIRDVDQANAIEIVLPISFAILGALVASRQPANVLGWLFLAISLTNAIPGLTAQYTRLALVTHPGAAFSPWIPWFGNLMETLVYPAGLVVMIMLLIPNGHLLSPRWRLVAWTGACLTVVLVVTTMLDPALIQFEGVPSVTNPTGIPGINNIGLGPIVVVAFLAALGTLLVAVSSIVIRLRRATGEERLQLRWIAYAAAFSILANVLATVLGIIFLSPAALAVGGTFITILGFGIALPASFGIAILRYRLYDLDLLLNRTVLYGAVTVVLAVAFGVANILAQRLMESIFQERSDLVAAGLGVGAAVAFGPMRRAIRPVVDRALPARGRLTLLFTDIVESTQAIVDLGDERWREVLHRYRSVVRRELSRCRGREVDTAGDAFFAIFDRPAKAVECAVAIRTGIRELGLRARTGLHIGDVGIRGETITGLAVHAAARVMAAAGDDQIMISSDLADLLGESVPLRDAGRHSLKGVPGLWQLFEVTAASP
jgi:class 3 adenylate cyclase